VRAVTHDPEYFHVDDQVLTLDSGMRMAGRMGDARVTVRNLEIIDVDTEDNVLVVKGAVPGPNGGYVVVRRAKR